MLIKKILLHKFTKFKKSSISTLEASFDKRIQIIVGTNGSGKSSLLNELFPYPPVKSSFSKTGMKSVWIEHEGKEFELTFTPEYGHVFLADGVNKNTNGSFNLQKELIDQHFNLNQYKQTVLKCGYSFSSMTPSQRKNLLFSLNPIDLTYLIAQYKKVHKVVVFYTNNLSMLNKRKEELLEKKLESSVYRQLLSSKELYQEKERLLLTWITEASTLLDNIKEMSSSTSLSEIQERCYFFEHKLKGKEPWNVHASRDYISRKNQEIVSLTSEKQRIQDNLEKLIERINDIDASIASAKSVNVNLDERLASIVEELASFSFSSKPVDSMTMTKIKTKLPEIENVLIEISHHSIAQMTDIETTKQRVQDTKVSLTTIKAELSSVKEEHENIRRMVKTFAIPEACPKGCELLDSYTTRKDSLDAKLTALNTRLAKLKETSEKMTSTIDQDTKFLNEQRQGWTHVFKLKQLIEDLPSIEEDLISLLNTNPFKVLKFYQHLVSEAERYVIFSKLQKELEDLKKDKKTQAKLANINIKYLEKELASKHTERSSLVKRLTEIDTRSSYLNTKVSELTEHLDTIEQLQSLERDVDVFEEVTAVQADKEYLTKVIGVLNSILDDVRSKLIELTTIVDEQRSIIERLELEIDKPIKQIKRDLRIAKKVEKGLLALQSKYNTTFLNDLVDISNHFLTRMMSYSVKLAKFKEGEKLKFKFPLTIDSSVTLDDISSCSTGQRCLIDLAMNLSLIFKLRLENYPIYLDEVEGTLDPVHKKNLLEVLYSLIGENIVSQMFIINHDIEFHNALDGDYVVLDDENIPSIPNSNVHVEIQR